jgi:hypothetical protein
MLTKSMRCASVWRRLHYLRLAGPPVLMFLIGMWGISGASFWRDEAATLSATRRPLGSLWHMLSRTDVVHGIYLPAHSSLDAGSRDQ